MEKQQFISDLTVGTEFSDMFLIGSAQQHQAKNGPYWRLEFRDKTGSIQGKIWSPHSLAHPDLAPGMLVIVEGRVSTYKDVPELSIDNLRVLSDEEKAQVPLRNFVSSSTRDPVSMMDELLTLCHTTLTHRPWAQLATMILADQQIKASLEIAPAAKGMHHTYAGGLLEHTLSVCHLCLRLADHYPQVDRQALFMGALCHDLGKIWELSYGLTTDYTSEGRLLGHIQLMLDRLNRLCPEAGLEPELALHLQHLVLSHHGYLEFGSPKLPATAEAMLLHYADNIDAKMQQIDTALHQVPENSWSAYNSGLERFLFRPSPTPSSLATTAYANEADIPPASDIKLLHTERNSSMETALSANQEVFSPIHDTSEEPPLDIWAEAPDEADASPNFLVESFDEQEPSPPWEDDTPPWVETTPLVEEKTAQPSEKGQAPKASTKKKAKKSVQASSSAPANTEDQQKDQDMQSAADSPTSTLEQDTAESATKKASKENATTTSLPVMNQCSLL